MPLKPKAPPPPYEYQEFPKMLYKLGERPAIVKDTAQEELLLSQGYQTSPVAEVPKEEPLSPEVQAQCSKALESQAAKFKAQLDQSEARYESLEEKMEKLNADYGNLVNEKMAAVQALSTKTNEFSAAQADAEARVANAGKPLAALQKKYDDLVKANADLAAKYDALVKATAK